MKYKLAIFDLDGTLLPPTKIMPAQVFPYINKLKDMGVTFAPASGRQLPNIKKMFAPVLDKIAIIAENGGLAWADGKIIFCDPTPAEGVKYALDIIAEHEGLYPLLSCADCAYYADDYEPFVDVLTRSYSSAKRVGAMISGYDWLDVSAPHANKGRAFDAILNYLGIDRSESVAFGDHMNDYEMLCAAGKAYMPENAFYKLKESGAGEIIGPHRDLSVIKKIGEIMHL